MSKTNLAQFLQARRTRLEKKLRTALKHLTQDSPKELAAAMHYTVLQGGKRIRPLLVYIIGEIYGVKAKTLDAPAVALEILHTFSLVHDDLPAMDNDSLRRGKPTCHLAFDEATAILTGDILAIVPFTILSGARGLTSKQKLTMIQVLAQAAGASGMAGGQYLDLHPLKKQRLTKTHTPLHMYKLKTSSLFEAAVKLGACAAGITRHKELQLLTQFATNTGIAFQIIDDILNIESNQKKLGKNVGTDKLQHKFTYPATVGMVRAKKEVQNIWCKTQKILSQLSCNHDLLQEFIHNLMQRDH